MTKGPIRTKRMNARARNAVAGHLPLERALALLRVGLAAIQTRAEATRQHLHTAPHKDCRPPSQFPLHTLRVHIRPIQARLTPRCSAHRRHQRRPCNSPRHRTTRMPAQHNSIIRALTALPAMISMRRNRALWRHQAMALVNLDSPPHLDNGPTGEEQCRVDILGGEHVPALHAWRIYTYIFHRMMSSFTNTWPSFVFRDMAILLCNPYLRCLFSAPLFPFISGVYYFLFRSVLCSQSSFCL